MTLTMTAERAETHAEARLREAIRDETLAVLSLFGRIKHVEERFADEPMPARAHRLVAEAKLRIARVMKGQGLHHVMVAADRVAVRIGDGIIRVVPCAWSQDVPNVIRGGELTDADLAEMINGTPDVAEPCRCDQPSDDQLQEAALHMAVMDCLDPDHLS